MIVVGLVPNLLKHVELFENQNGRSLTLEQDQLPRRQSFDGGLRHIESAPIIQVFEVLCSYGN